MGEKASPAARGAIVRSESVKFGYDSAGLLTKKEISSKLGIEAITAYEYDKNGNLKKKVDFYGIHSKTETYTYTAFGELKTAEVDNFFAEYYYGADGFRSGKKVNGVSTGYVYDGMYIVGESVDGVNYTYSRGTDLLGYTSSLGETVYYRTNVHGDVKELVNVFGESLERYDYNAYGAEDEDYNPFRRMFGKKSVYNPFRYTGEYTDSETGLVYLRNRMYDPETGRFISEDPAKDGLNWYAYCEGNPITKIDPWGLGPYDRFKSRDEAATDFGLYIGQKSIDEEEEFAACIYTGTDENGDTYYFYDTPRNELDSHEKRSIQFYISWDGTYGTPVAITHTHGAYDATTENEKDGFSTPDNVASGDYTMSDAYCSNESGIDYYLIAPNGNMRVYKANSGNYTGELLSTNMIVDSRIQIYQQMKGTLLWGLLQSKYPKGTAQDYVNARLKNPDSLLGTINDLESYR